MKIISHKQERHRGACRDEECECRRRGWAEAFLLGEAGGAFKFRLCVSCASQMLPAVAWQQGKREREREKERAAAVYTNTHRHTHALTRTDALSQQECKG